MPPRQTILDPGLTLQKPVQRLVGLTLLHPAQPRCPFLIHRTHKAEFGARRDQTVHHHRYHQIAIAPRRGILRRAQDQAVQSELADHPQNRRHMAMPQRPLNLQIFRARAPSACPP